jgi:hypothetical protein
MLRAVLIGFFLLLIACACQAQTDSTGYNPNWDYQIYLKQPAKEIKELLYDNTCAPANGKIADDGKTIVIKDYQKKARIYVKVIYTDGTEDEFVRSSCFIDPVL